MKKLWGVDYLGDQGAEIELFSDREGGGGYFFFMLHWQTGCFHEQQLNFGIHNMSLRGVKLFYMLDQG